ncbi:MAG: L,D-transpeptidase [Chloroflexaceae bacterium]|nr:L,D-transpeptidase [Chloroflexaceae bacterium]
MYHRSIGCCLLFVAVVLVPLLASAPVQAAATVTEPFASYYARYHGPRTLGAINSEVVDVGGVAMQYFEKGRLEDHRWQTDDPLQQVAYSRLTLELIQSAPEQAIDGLPVTYGSLQARMNEQMPPPVGFTGGTMALDDGVFVPFDANLGITPGYIVPWYFWNFINRAHLFPAGWLHAAGLPLGNAFSVLISGNGTGEQIMIQAFERTVLIYRPGAEWPVQRANIGTDMLWAQGQLPLVQSPDAALMNPPAMSGPRRIEVSLGRQWLAIYQGDQLVFDAPVSTGKDGFNTPPGRYAIYHKLTSQHMRGNQGGETWDIPGVPWVMYYQDDVAIHGVYWHQRFGTGERLSHGCVGLAPNDAGTVYEWAPIGTPVIVY